MEKDTLAIKTQIERSQFLEHSAPLYLTSSFVFEDSEDMRASFAEEKDRNIYSRFSNPNVSEFIEKIALLEEAEDGVAFATGMAAVYNTLVPFLNAGDHVVSASSIFGSTHTLFTKYLPKWNISTTYFDINKPETITAAIQQNTKILFVETPTNPGVDVIDLQLLGQIANKHNLLLVVDNTFATPFVQNPISLGAHLVIHSATKLIDGQGRVLGGVTVGFKDLIREIYLFSRNTGPALAPFNAWLLSKSLETLSLRVEKQSQNALQLATYLEQHPKVKSVKYPFLPSHPQYAIAKKQMQTGGTIVAFELHDGKDAGKAFIDANSFFSVSANLGDTRTIITHPASSTHSKLSKEELKQAHLTEGLIRISVGLESYKDIVTHFNLNLK
ncbi:aminotransferase class I/II-fold pyridoxal phosphate-dependent enzyme [Flavobacterium agricola]|uniref:Aminotransferase class I/II-fold pyridoxal phosphate-dependent enzyme n=1 Tax=Flavobacterium agricola TaxID=2870839 RepID=A0ABY6M0X2_9FLAO|nr:aminotransferase class I/II-fold pyridoxal phosphate-dependent enzyme [Flavobacterium agricola]UYW01365.1 aminotransferase class I/II-fold pyridoxal phosphate-dependent enzyme [Flavobacterium agricola]